MDLPGELLGQRVSLRHRIGDRDGRPLYSDAVGPLYTDGDALVVETRRGPVRVARDAVVAVRAVPPAPPRRASLTAIVRLEGLCADVWPAEVDEPLGDWRLRAAGGYTARANTALAIGDPGLPVPAALDAVRAFATRHAVAPRVQVPIGSPWDRAVAAQGWVLDVGHAAGAEVAVLVADLSALPGSAAPVELLDAPADAWWELATGGPPTPAQRHVLAPGTLRVTFALARDPDGSPIGAVRGAVAEDHLHLSVLEVAPRARRRGLASDLVAAAAAWGSAHGARWAVLQVALHKAGARAFYQRLGFVEHHRYRYLVPPPA